MLVEAVVFLQVEFVQEILFHAQSIWNRLGAQSGAQTAESSLGFEGQPLADSIRRY